MNPAQALAEVPSLKDELQRKAFEHIEHLAIQLESGRIGEAQFETGVRAVWACVSGLVDKWLIDTISEITDKRDTSYSDFRVLGKNGIFVLLYRLFGGAVVYMTPLTGSVRAREWSFKDEPNPSAAALKKINEVQAGLIGGGFTLFGDDQWTT